MLRPRITIDAAEHRARLDGAVGAIRRERDATDPDPFDEAMVAAVVGIAEVMKAEADALAEMTRRLRKVPR